MSVGGGDGTIARYVLHTRSNLSAALNEWTTQLEEFAHKGIARRDTQAVTAIVRTMAHIGEKYSDVRRDSMFLLPDFSGGMPIGVSDIGTVLDPIYESIKRICEDAKDTTRNLYDRWSVEFHRRACGHRTLLVSIPRDRDTKDIQFPAH